MIKTALPGWRFIQSVKQTVQKFVMIRKMMTFYLNIVNTSFTCTIFHHFDLNYACSSNSNLKLTPLNHFMKINEWENRIPPNRPATFAASIFISHQSLIAIAKWMGLPKFNMYSRQLYALFTKIRYYFVFDG